MNLIKQDFKKGIVKLRITDPDDLWYLSSIIEPGDLVKSVTTRKIRIGEGDNAKVTKKTYFLKIEAETIDFGDSGQNLRINGKIKEGPEEVPKDSYHSLSLEEGTEFSLEKVNWMSYHKQKLQESAEKKYNYLICILDREEALFALTKNYGYTILVKIKGDVPKKAKKVEIKKDFQQELIKALEVYNERYKPEAIVIASPAFYKEDLFKKIINKLLRAKIVLATTSGVDENSLDEVIKSPELANTLKSSRARAEHIIIEELLSAIKKDTLAAYGEKEVKKAVELGAVSVLLLTDNFIKKKKENKEFEEIDQFMKKVDSLQGKIHLISSEHDGGKKLDGLGGLASLLRYKIS